MDRPSPWLRPVREPDRPGDYHELICRWERFYLSAPVARDVERQLEAEPPPRWITFRDLQGARHRLRAREVHGLSESTRAQRAALRAFERARCEEPSDDEPRREAPRDDEPPPGGWSPDGSDDGPSW